MPAEPSSLFPTSRPTADAERVVRVLPDVSGLRKSFDYTVPAKLAGDIRVGTQVRVALAGRRVGGWVVADDVDPPPGVALRPVAAVRGWGPPPAVLELAQWAAWRWAGPVATLLRTASWHRAARALPAVAPGAGGIRPPERRDGADVGGDGALGGATTTAALSGGTAVVRLGPGADPWPLCVAAVERLARCDDDSGVLVLAPGRRVAMQLARRLRSAGAPVALLPDEWPRARAGRCVAVGTRAAAFAPLPRLAAAVVLDAHDEAYHEERAPTWAAWAVVVERARRDGAPCALVSPCPSLDLLAAGPLVVPSRADERRSWPVVEVIDRRADDPRTGLFSSRLVEIVRAVAARPDGRVVCVINRTGRVRVVGCAACGELARCDCGAALELVGPAVRRPARGADAAVESEQRPPVLRCRRCGSERPVVCNRCGATRTRALRIGVSRVREDLEALAGVPVTEVWGPNPAPDDDGSGVLADHNAETGDARVVVGTEAALHRVRSADVVVFLDFDSELLAPRFAAGEQALALLARAARLVAPSAPTTVSSGTTGTPATSGTSGVAAPSGARAGGRVVIQTRLARHPAVVAAVSADPGTLAEAESEMRRGLGLPPFRAMAVVSGAQADALGTELRAAAPDGVEVSGPFDGSWSVRAPDHRTLCDLLAAVPRPAGRVRVEVDPTRA